MRRLAIYAAAALTALAFGLAHVQGAHADTYEVCGYGVSAGGPSSCMTLADAIAAASATGGRDTIRMYPGSYCPINLESGGGNQGIDFVGMGIGGLNLSEPGALTGSEAGLTTFAWQELYCGSDAPSALATVNAFGRFTFRNLSFDGRAAGSPSNGIVVPGGQPTDLTLRDVLVQNMTGIGVSYQSGTGGFSDASMDIESSAVVGNGTGVQSSGFASILSSTVAGNTVGVVPRGKMSLLEDTISHNTYGVDAVCCGNSMQAVNTLLAGNTTADCEDSADWEAGSLGSDNNIVGDTSCHNPKGADTALDPGTTIRAVALNGGPTPSIVPPSQADAAGSPNACSPDQREFVSSTGICDVGSVQQGSTDTPVLNADPVDFGQIDPAVAVTRSVSFANGGGGQVDVSAVTLDGAGYTMVSDGCTHTVLVPGNFGSLAGCQMTVSLLPTAAGEWDGTITLSTTAGSKDIALTAQAVLRPLGTDDSYDVDGATLAVVAPGVLQNDVAGTTVDEVVSDPSNGTLTGPNADGSFSYAPDGGFTGDDSFQYTIIDGEGAESHPITVTLHVLSAAAGPPLYVDASWDGIEPGVDPDGEGPATAMGVDAFSTVSDAVSVATGGSTIHIAAGTYDESGNDLRVDDAGVQLVGAGAASTHVTVSEIRLGNDRDVLQGLDLHGTGIWDGGSYTGSDGPVVNVISGSGTAVRDCTISDSFDGVVAATGELGFVNDVTVENNDISHVVNGIVLDGVDGGSVTSNDVHDTGNSVGGGNGQPQAAILLENSEEVDLADGAAISDNTVSAVGNIGISVRTGNNTLDGNTITGTGASYPHFKEPSGIELTGQGNTISNNTIDASAFAGIKIDFGGGNTIDGNTITGTLHGGADGGLDPAAGGAAILITVDGAPGTTITHNTLSGNSGWGVLQLAATGNSTDTVANENDIVGNTLGGVKNLDSTTLDATENWWGDASGPAGDGPGIGATVAGASFDPWLLCSIAQSDCAPPANEAPTASFSSTVNDLAVSLDASASSDADGSVASYAWDFGDEASGTGATASHTYASAGTFTITLTVTDDDGATSSLSHDVKVAVGSTNQSPVASFTSSTSNLSVSVDASASSDADGTIASYAWDFGDGASGTGATASHTYASAGTYTVTLAVTDDDAATTDSSAAVTVTAPAPPPTTTTTTTATTPAPRAPAPVAPTAAFSVSPGRGEATTTAFLFDASGSTRARSYAWDFGDGTHAGGVKPSHVFGRPGSYTVRLTVSGEGGLNASATHSVTVAPLPPHADFSSSPLRPVPGRTVGFMAATAAVAGGVPLASYAWDFGDGESGTGANAGHVYRRSGSYRVTLTVTDAAGQTATATATVGVVAANRPSVIFQYNPVPVAAGADETFASLAIRRFGRFAVTKIVDWKWTFGDLSPIVHGSQVHHAFAAVGSYRVHLTVRDAGGRTGTVASTIVVLPRDSVIAVVETISTADAPTLVPPAVLGITEPIGTSDRPALTPPDRITVVETIGTTDGTAPIHH